MFLSLQNRHFITILWISFLFLGSINAFTQEAAVKDLDAKSVRKELAKIKSVRLRMLAAPIDSLATIKKYLEQTKLIAITQEQPELLAQVSYNLGLLHFYAEDYIKAIPPLQSAVDNVQNLSYLDSLILFNNITISFTEIKAFNSAVQYVGTLEYLIRKDPEQYKKIRSNIASLDGLYFNLGMYQDAIRIFYERIQTGEVLDKSSPYTYAINLFDLGRYYNANTQTDSALHYFQSAQSIVESSNFEDRDYFIGLIKGNMAQALIQQSKYDEAIPLLKADYLESLRAKDYKNSSKTLNVLAYCELKTGDIDNALRHLQGVASLVKPSKYPEIYYTNTYYLSQTFGALRQYDSAFWYAKKYIQLTDSMRSNRTIEKTAQLAVSIELRHKEQIMQKALVQIHKEKQNALKGQKTLKWIVGGAIILAVLLLFVLLLLRKTNVQKIELQELITDYEKKTFEVEKSLQQKEYLLKEIHHRVKNNLQIVSGILQLQSVHNKNKEFKEIMQQSQNRIKSMALIHQMLYQNEDIRYIPFRSYLDKLCSQLTSALMSEAKRIKVNIIIEEIKFDVETAIPLGLIVNELLSNAIKYAYPGDMEGEIDIWLKQESKNQFTLIVSDDGVGLPESFDIKSADTLGLQLVNMLANQMKSNLSYRRNKGSEFSIKFKLKNEIK